MHFSLVVIYADFTDEHRETDEESTDQEDEDIEEVSHIKCESHMLIRRFWNFMWNVHPME